MPLWNLFRSSGFVSKELRRHFGTTALNQLVTTTRKFPTTIRVDLQYALDRYLDGELKARSHGINSGFDHLPASFSIYTVEGEHGGKLGPIQYDEIDIGWPQPAQLLLADERWSNHANAQEVA